MPPHQTNFTPETGREAAGLDLAIASVNVAPRNASAGMRPDPSIAAQRDASSEKESAGPPVTPPRNVLSVLLGYWRALRKQRQVESLNNLSDRELADIGLTRSDVDYLFAHRAIDRLRDVTTLWLSRGV